MKGVLPDEVIITKIQAKFGLAKTSDDSYLLIHKGMDDWEGDPNDEHLDLKVEIENGETIKEAVGRILLKELGLELLSIDLDPKNLQLVNANVKYGPVKAEKYQGYNVQWSGGYRTPRDWTKYNEAREWLKNNKNKTPLSSGRFDKQSAIKFVDNLYTLGAELVVVDQIFAENSHLGIKNGPYADALIVKLPENLEKRKKLLKVMNEEVKPKFPDYRKYTDEGQYELYFSWK